MSNSTSGSRKLRPQGNARPPGVLQELCTSGLKPELGETRPKRCMGTLSGVLALPGFGSRVAAKKRVDYENTPEGALVRRAQGGDESAFREIVEKYQSKVFSIIHGIVRHRIDTDDIAQQ